MAADPPWKAFTPDDSPKTPVDVMQDPVHIDLATADLTVGDLAFDFDLEVFDFADGTKRRTGRSLHLQSVAANQPVALIFGSYT